MGSCIICGTSVDGRICDLHEEDVVFEFRGDRPSQLTPGRYYRGTVDGYADFGVFIDIGDSVTGLLHRSELDRRLESLDWEPGDVVFVQVQDVRDNGNVDLGWSIRQGESEFRGTLIDDPGADEPVRRAEQTA
ncbi:MAG: S1 RNA-binding domain-containing protein, partial [Salinirussus sp.]